MEGFFFFGVADPTLSFQVNQKDECELEFCGYEKKDYKVQFFALVDLKRGLAYGFKVRQDKESVLP